MERTQDIFIVYIIEKPAIIIDVAILWEKIRTDKKKKKIEKYLNLKREILRLWNFKKINVIPLVLRAVASVTKNFKKICR